MTIQKELREAFEEHFEHWFQCLDLLVEGAGTLKPIPAAVLKGFGTLPEELLEFISQREQKAHRAGRREMKAERTEEIVENVVSPLLAGYLCQTLGDNWREHFDAIMAMIKGDPNIKKFLPTPNKTEK